MKLKNNISLQIGGSKQDEIKNITELLKKIINSDSLQFVDESRKSDFTIENLKNIDSNFLSSLYDDFNNHRKNKNAISHRDNIVVLRRLVKAFINELIDNYGYQNILNIVSKRNPKLITIGELSMLENHFNNSKNISDDTDIKSDDIDTKSDTEKIFTSSSKDKIIEDDIYTKTFINGSNLNALGLGFPAPPILPVDGYYDLKQMDEIINS